MEAEEASPRPNTLPPPSVDPNDQKKTACYDIDVEVDDPLKAQMSNFLASTTNQQEIASLDAKVRGPPLSWSPQSCRQGAAWVSWGCPLSCVMFRGTLHDPSSHPVTYSCPSSPAISRSMRPSNPSTS